MKKLSISILILLSFYRLTASQEVRTYEPGFLGCLVVELTEDEREKLTSVGFHTAAKVERIMPESPAEKAAIQINDFIMAVNGSEIKDPKDLTTKIIETGAGTTVDLLALRNGKLHSFEVILSRNPFIESEKPDTSPGLNEVKIVKDIAYYDGEDAHPEKHKLNLFLPESKVPFPVIMWIHAGGWSIGDREGETALAMRFAERGIAVAAISRRLSSATWLDPESHNVGVVHPEHVKDCARAFSWLLKNIERYGGDPKRLFISGHSSGAHLASLVATDPKYLAEYNISLNSIKGVIPIEGAYDIVGYHRLLIEYNGREQADAHIHSVFETTEEQWGDASPTNYLSGNEVSFLVMTGTGSGDGHQIGFRNYLQHFEEASKNAEKSTIRFMDAKNRDHGNIILLMTRKDPDSIRKEILDFVRKQG